jgi:D-xylose transport system permease protein
MIFFIITTWSGGAWPWAQIVDGRSVASIITNATSQGIIAVGVTMLMISGEFDLSVGSTLGLSALMFILAADRGPGGLVELIPGISEERVVAWGISYGGMSGLASVAVSLATGALLGLFNGLLLVWTRIPSFIVTLGTLYIYRSIMLNIIPGGTIARYLREPITWNFSPIVLIALVLVVVGLLALLLAFSMRLNWRQLRQGNNNQFGPISRLGLTSVTLIAAVAAGVLIIIGFADDLSTTISVPFFEILNGKLGFVKENFRSSIIWWALIAIVFTIILNHTRYGNAVFATGGNPQAARAQGINVNRVKVTNFVISGTLAAVAGIMEAARFSVVEPLRGQGYELDVIAATVIGGTLLTGGYGSIFGSVLGILIAFMLKTGLVLIGVQADWFRGVLGMIMIGAVIINTNIRRQR